MTNKIDRIPPNSIDLEMTVLGSMMIDDQAAETVLEILDDSAFFKDAHKVIYRAMQKIHRKGDPVDLQTVTEGLHSEGKLDEAGGAAYLAECTGMVASSANTEHHARILLRKSVLRKMMHECVRTIDTCYTEPDDLQFIDQHEQEVYNLTLQRFTKEAKPLGQYLKINLDQLNIVKANQTLGVTSGFKTLDDLTAGWQSGDLMILAGRPSMGKTAFSLALARNAVKKADIAVGMFSLEMGGDQLSQRILSAETKINSHLIRTGKITSDEVQRIHTQAHTMMNDRIFIDDTAGLTISGLRSKTRRLCKQHEVGLLFIDHLGLMEAGYRTQSEHLKISEISRATKRLAKDLTIPVILLCQLSRRVEERPDKKPILSDLRESGSIEENADQVIFIYRPGFYGLTDKQKIKYDDSFAKIIIAKNRMGPLGELIFKFEKEYGRFLEGTFRDDTQQNEVPF